jgi:hypothetical protein
MGWRDRGHLLVHLGRVDRALDAATVHCDPRFLWGVPYCRRLQVGPALW